MKTLNIMKTLKRITPFLLIGIMSFVLILSSCKKEDDTPEPTPTPTPTPTDLQNYVGATADYAKPVTFTTGEKNGEIWMIAYSVYAKYITPDSTQSYTKIYSSSNSSGIKQFTSNVISIDAGAGLTFTATIKEDGKHIDGNYIYNYTGSLTHTADFATDRE
jgi:hypothetical protein